jgi:hypothetical protein
VNDNEFVTLQRMDGSTVAVLDLQTLALYLESTEAAIWLGQPGFVSDEYLATVDADTTTCALELELEGLWVRIDVGYYNVGDRTNIATQDSLQLPRSVHPDPETE